MHTWAFALVLSSLLSSFGTALMKKSVLVFGGNGYVGTEVVNAIHQDAEVLLLLRSYPEKNKELIQLIKNEKVKVIYGDIMLDKDLWLGYMKTTDYFINLAINWENPSEISSYILSIIEEIVVPYRKTNNIKNLIYIFTSGHWTYASKESKSNKALIINESTVNDNPFDFVKWELEFERRLLANEDILAVALQPTYVYGKKGSITSNWFSQIKQAENDSIKIPGSKDTIFPFIHIFDIAAIYKLIVNYDRIEELKGKQFLLATDNLRIGDCLDQIRNIVKKGSKLEIIYYEPELTDNLDACLAWSAIVESLNVPKYLPTYKPLYFNHFLDNLEFYYNEWIHYSINQ